LNFNFKSSRYQLGAQNRADAAQVRNNVGFVFEDGRRPEEWSAAIAARHIVSERW
jgi:hypothetical protein